MKQTSHPGCQEKRKVEFIAGKAATLHVEPPGVAISANARPCADVLLDRTNISQTPLANMLVTVGSHELVFSNLQFGERKRTVIVTASGLNRIAADLVR